ncbi:MAG: hypothetical protein ABIH23_23555 [bacterium]
MKQFIYASVLIGLLASGVMAQPVADPTGVPPVTLENSGLDVLVPSTWIIREDMAKGSYWEPAVDIFADGTAVVISGVHAFLDQPDTYNSKIAVIDMAGNITEYWAWYTDDGQPYEDNFNESRTDGNPPRVACSKLPGNKHYMVAQEATPYWYPEFNTDGRWDTNWEWTSQTATVQIFNLGASGPEKVTGAFDPIYGVGDPVGTQASQCRFGGEIICLSNGNFLTIPEDRGEGIFPFRSPTATLFSETGAVLKMPFNGNIDQAKSSDIWSNAAAGKGFWAARLAGVFNVWNNDCTPKFAIDQDLVAPGIDRGRGDGVRISADPASTWVYFGGKNAEDFMSLSRFDVATSSAGVPGSQKEVYVNGEEYWDTGVFDRVDVANDAFGNSCILWDESFSSGNDQCVARIYNSAMEPVSPIFYPFWADTWDGAAVVGYVGYEPNVAMDNHRIILSCNGVGDDGAGGVTEAEQTFVTIVKNPMEQEVPVKEWSLY